MSNEAMEELDAVLEKYFRGQLSPYEAMNQIARIRGSVEGQQQ